MHTLWILIFSLLSCLTYSHGAPPSARPRLAGALQIEGEHWTYRDGDLTMSGILLMPEGTGPFPAVLISHGLGGSAESFGRFQAHHFLRWGMVCIAPNYTHDAAAARRREPGAVPPVQRRDFGASTENLRRASACLDILRSLPEVDPRRLGAYGHSMGGFVTIGVAAMAPDGLKAAAISGSGIAPREGFPAPSTASAGKIRTPLLMLHGSSDTTVRPEQSAALHEVLNANRVPNDRHVFEGQGHQFNGPQREEAFNLIRAWFAKHGLFESQS